MSLPASAFRPLAIGLLLAVGGCGQSTQQQAAQPSMTKQAPLADLAAKREARRAMPTAAPMLESYALPVAPEPLPAYCDSERKKPPELTLRLLNRLKAYRWASGVRSYCRFTAACLPRVSGMP